MGCAMKETRYVLGCVEGSWDEIGTSWRNSREVSAICPERIVMYRQREKHPSRRRESSLSVGLEGQSVYGQVKNPYGTDGWASLLRAEMYMTCTQFTKFVSLIRSAAMKHLNCGLRLEEQDPDDLQRFKQMVHQHQPDFSKRYADSWPVMAYLEIYLSNRVRKAIYLKNCRKANKTGHAPFKRNLKASVKAYTKKPTKHQHDEEIEATKSVYPQKNRVSVVIKKVPKSFVIQISDSESNTEGETDVRPPSPPPAPSPRAIAPPPSDPILDFLSSARPSLADFHNHFINMGIIDNNGLNAFFSWPVDMQENMVRTELGRLMNPLQLYGLLVAMRERRESST
ncbi:hypothetical protein EDD15DRAFT_2200197 [Pisolithus albus]|nr:hypothetical protein EDD15DRAFT_2200197 [Pisolithus albus]